MSYVLSNSSAEKVRQLIAEQPGASFAYPGGSSGRQVAFIKLTSSTATSGFYPCVVSQFDSIAGTWADGSEGAKVVEIEGNTLASGDRLAAYRVGNLNDGTGVFVACKRPSAAFSGVRLTGNLGTYIPYKTGTQIAYNGETYDTDSYHSTVTNIERITAPVTGYYHVGAYGIVSNNAGSSGVPCVYKLTILKNSVTTGVEETARNEQFYVVQSGTAGDDVPITLTASADCHAIAGDYWVTQFIHGQSGSSHVLYEGQTFWCHRLG